MTMLDRMRRHKTWLKWSLGIVVAAFVLLYVPSFLRPGGAGAAATDVLATVDGREVLIGIVSARLPVSRSQSLRSAYGDQFNEQHAAAARHPAARSSSSSSTKKRSWPKPTASA